MVEFAAEVYPTSRSPWRSPEAYVKIAKRGRPTATRVILLGFFKRLTIQAPNNTCGAGFPAPSITVWGRPCYGVSVRTSLDL